ncbi:hypothetical protein MN869_09470 [Acinetobacter sp. NIPH1876]|uniref:hypothetical protein n=1 Tax=Acinetobacter sp. NIPH1876 TaxID=2924041 RepID=UPI001FAC183E|nr:hypothetical protein [Acinetobacter sp. NIPH1876]MCJ0828675.1 hypothetical protein [Acinetobacter sp. NIPH1876]
MRSEFEKNRYWIGLFKTDVEFNALLGEFGRYELNGSRDVNHSYLEAFNGKWEAYAKAWNHRQTEVDELQKRMDAARKLIDDWNCGGVNLFDSLEALEQALKGNEA